VPVRKVGKNCYQWGNQKVYCGTDAKRKAILQGIAIENTGWKEAENEIDVKTNHYSFVLPAEFDENNEAFYLVSGYLLISTDKEGKWRVWDLDKGEWRGWNWIDSPFYKAYQKKYPLTPPHYFQFDTLQDAEKHTSKVALTRLKNVIKWIEGDEDSLHGSDIALSLISKGKRSALRMKMDSKEKEMARHPNRSQRWIPDRLRKELSNELRKQMVCPTCGEAVFPSLLAAQRHHFYCEKYGKQPSNYLFMTPLELLMFDFVKTKKEAESFQTPIIFISGIALLLGMALPYFLDSRADKV
jgi:hypothetical protein